MKKKRLWVYRLRDSSVALVTFLFLAWSGALFAEEARVVDLPSSQDEAKGLWTRMRASSFPATSASARKQCEKDATVYDDDTLTSGKCDLLYQKLTEPESFPVGEQCQSVLVPDGIRFDFMNGYLNGHHGITEDIQKSLNRYDRADLCSLGDGVFAYFFRNDPGKSCNNVGFVLLPLPPVEKPTVCRFESTGETWEGGISTYVTAIFVDGHFKSVYLPAVSSTLPSKTSTNSRLICE